MTSSPRRVSRFTLLLLVAALPGALAADDLDDGRSGSGGDDGEDLPTCQILTEDLTLLTDEGLCSASGDSIDPAVFDQDGRVTILAKDPPGPYPLGDTLVTFTLGLPRDAVTQCMETVTVVDRAAPVVECNAPASITPPETPISFTASATDNCSVASVVVAEIECWKVNPAGKRLDRARSCSASAEGDTLTVVRSGGVGSHFRWTATATDGSGNAITRVCTTEVVAPGG